VPEAQAPQLPLLLGVFARASALARGQPESHAHRTCLVAMEAARQMGLGDDEKRAVYFTSLLAHCGCTAGLSQMAAFIASDEIAAQRDMCLCDPNNAVEVLGWMKRNVAPSAPLPERAQRLMQMFFNGEKLMGEAELGCSDVGARIGQRLGLPQASIDGLRFICETWNGKGPRKLAKGAIPLSARIAHAAMVADVYHRERGPEAALEAMQRRAGRSLDPEVVKALVDAARVNGFWDRIGKDDVEARVAAAGPRSESPAAPTFVDDVAFALADFVDLKAPLSASHSRAVSKLADEMGAKLGLSDAERTLLRRAALIHDLGLIAIPSFVLTKKVPGPVDRAQLELHPQHLERLLQPIPSLHEAAALAAKTHERLDGSGYPAGLRGDALPLAARILAVADAYDEAVRGTMRESALSPEAARAELQSKAFDPDCVRALLEVTGSAASRRSLPGGLTERQVEVLVLAARGLALKEIAGKLGVSPHTARHHLEAVYEKLGINSRAGAALFAMEHGLLD
jgi:HD-GYP domain-containing protein (c-di-GMP phosphodiesterase class II)